MSNFDTDATQQAPWEERQEAQEQKVVGMARQLIAGQGSDLYRKTLASFLSKEPRGLYRLEPFEQDELNTILEQERLAI